MTQFGLFITFYWLNTVSLQHIQSDGLGVGSADQIQEYSMPYMSFLDVPSRHKFDHSSEVLNSNEYNQFYQRDDVELQDNVRRRRSDSRATRDIDDQVPNLDHDKTFYLTNSAKLTESPLALHKQLNEKNDTDIIYGSIQKRSFSPWGGKRNELNTDDMWSWKRISKVRESSKKGTPFNPWGGKRSIKQPQNQESKRSKIIFSSYIPEIERAVSTSAPPVNDRMNLAGLQYISPVDKRHPIRVLTLSDDVELQDNVRRRRSDSTGTRDMNDQVPNLDYDKTFYLTNSAKLAESPFALQQQIDEKNDTDVIYGPIQKRSFSPWGGKRNEPNINNMWSWKRISYGGTKGREESGFSPWGGGKRSIKQPQNQESKGSKIIFSSYIPEITRIVSRSAPSISDRMNVAGFQYISPVDKRHPIRVLALRENLFDRAIKAPPLSYNSNTDSTEPQMYKPGHPYQILNLKKDGKRKVKFSSWGGKRAAALIGPIWSPFPQGLTDSTLKAILLVRKNTGLEKKPIVAL